MELGTRRLILRELREGDYAVVRACQGFPEVTRLEKGALNEEQTRAYLRGAAAAVRDAPRTLYRLAITLRREGALIGDVRLERLQAEIREWEIGWYLQ